MNKADEKQKDGIKPINKQRITFDDFDKLNLKPFGLNLFQIIEQGVNSQIGEKGAYTISLNAKFGNGKTTFLEMFKNFIEKENYNVLFINAWASDFYQEPVIYILSEFINWVKENYGEKDQKDLKKIIKVIGNIGNQIVQSKTGIDVEKTIKSSQQSGIIGNLIYKNLQLRKEAIKDIKEEISKYTKNKRLIILVDELDRARPDYAVHFLEDMKHFFDIKNIIFLIATNRKQMESTVKCLYGQDLDFNGYYRKFFKQEINLPDPYIEAQRFVDELIQKNNNKIQHRN